MRSRPKVATYLRPSVAVPGSPLDVEVVLTSTSETPIDFVEMLLEGRESVQFGRYASGRELLRRRVRHGDLTLGVEQRRLRGRFELPADVPPTYRGAAASIAYTLDVHVSIPWWPDRRQRFMIPVAPRPVAFTPTPRTCLSALEGPKGTTPFIELSLDSTTLEIGGELAGAVSVANTGHGSIRGVDLELTSVEVPVGGTGSHEARRVRWRLLDGPPGEGQSIPFRVALNRGVGVGLMTPMFQLQWYVEVVVDVVWGADARLRAPVTLVPPATETTRGGKDARASRLRWVAPVGRERRALTWATVADRYGLTSDPEQERMVATIGAIAMSIQLQDRGTQGLFGLATLRWPDVGLDLHVEPRSLTDLFTREVDLGRTVAARRLTVRAREPAQARAVLGDDALQALTELAEVHLDDEGATVGAPCGAATVPQLEAFVTAVLRVTRALAFGLARIPPPKAMEAQVPAWAAFAQARGGQLVVGAMRIRDLRLGTEAGEIATLWSRTGGVEGTALRVPLSPPLEAALDPDAPGASPEARSLVAELHEESRALRLGPDTLEALVAGPLDDPGTVEPLLDKLARLSRAARGAPPAGPYR
jgi:hypothetical protein